MWVNFYIPAKRNILFSFAIFENASVDWPGIGSAYSGKYLLPYGELQHS
jgi:hypothetical protein